MIVAMIARRNDTGRFGVELYAAALFLAMVVGICGAKLKNKSCDLSNVELIARTYTTINCWMPDAELIE